MLWNGDGRLERLTSTGPLVPAAIPACEWEQLDVRLAVGERLLLYTDGVSDTLASDLAAGEDRIISLVEEHAEGGQPLLDVILTHVKSRLGGRRQPDDVTLLTARRLR